MTKVRYLLIKPLVILGAGGHTSVLVDILRQNQREILGLVSPDVDIDREVLADICHYYHDEDVLTFESDNIVLVNGIGSLPGNTLRTKIYKKFTMLGFTFDSVVAPSAIVSPYAKLGQGVQVMAGAIIQAGAVIGDNTIINTGAIIEHDCVIGSHNHIAPGVTLSGEVHTSDQVHVGTGASVVQCIAIGDNVVIGAGATITKNVPADHIAYSCRTTMIKRKG